VIKYLIKLLFQNPNCNDNQGQIEAYLADSYDLIDLERRQRQISKGEAPWQQQANFNSRGWT